MRLIPTLLGILIGLSSAGTGWSLDPRLDVGGFRDEDRVVAEEVARFSAEERHAALLAAGHPEDLLEVQQIQRESADDFAKLVEGFSREDQEQIWDLVRYPGLVADLARDGAKTDPELERIAQRYPEEIRAAIRSEGRERYATWVEIYALDLQAEQAFSSVIARHPEDVRSAFQRLRGRPDLLSVLVDEVAVTTRIGAAYREDPTRVEARFDSLHQEVAARRNEQEKSWTKELQDPESRKQLETAAREFAEDQGYSLDDQNNPSVVQTRVVHVDHYVNANPYPYWFGYPSWYSYPSWYPSSVWSHVGFGFGGGGNAYVSVGIPSPYFLGWYNNYYGGSGFGYGFGGGYGGAYGYGASYGGGYWNSPNYYYGGHRSHHHYRSARHDDHHRPRNFHGNRHHSDGLDGRDGAHADRGHRSPQEHLTSRPHRDVDTRIGNRDGNRDGARGRSADGRKRIHPDRRSHGNGRGDSGNVQQIDPNGNGSQGGTRIERGHRSLRSREAGGDPNGSGLGRDRGRRQPPDVSSGPPSRIARSERHERFPGTPQINRAERTDRRGSSQREFVRPSRDAARNDGRSSGGRPQQHVGRSNHGGPGPTIGGSSGGGRSRGGGHHGGGAAGGGGRGGGGHGGGGRGRGVGR